MNEAIQYRNAALKGIELRTNKDGTDRFRIRIRKKGQEEVSRTYRTETLARKISIESKTK